MPSRLPEILKHELSHLLAGSAWIYALRIGGAGLTFVTHLVLAHTIGADELGRYVLAFSTAMIVGFVCTLCLPSAAMRFVPTDIEQGRKDRARGYLLLSRKVIVGLSLSAWVLFTAGALVLLADAPPAVLWTNLFGAALIPICAALIALTDLGRALSMMTSTFAPSFIVRQLGLFVLVASMLLLGVALDAAWITGLTLLTTVPLVIWQYRVTRRRARDLLGEAPPTYETRRWVMSAVPLVFVFGFVGFFLELNVTIAGQVLPAGELAAYNLAFQLVNLAGFALVAIDYKIGPELASHLGAGRIDAFNLLLRRATALRTVVGILIVAALAVAGPMILALFGPQFELAMTALLILALTQVIAGATGPVGEIHMFLGLERQGLAVSMISVVTAVVLTPLLTLEWGLEGAAWSVLVSTSIWEFGLLAVIWRRGIQPSILAWIAPSARGACAPPNPS